MESKPPKPRNRVGFRVKGLGIHPKLEPETNQAVESRVDPNVVTYTTMLLGRTAPKSSNPALLALMKAPGS